MHQSSHDIGGKSPVCLNNLVSHRRTHMVREELFLTSQSKLDTTFLVPKLLIVASLSATSDFLSVVTRISDGNNRTRPSEMECIGFFVKIAKMLLQFTCGHTDDRN